MGASICWTAPIWEARTIRLPCTRRPPHRTRARGLLASAVGSQAADLGFKSAATNGAVVAWKIVEQNGAPTLQPAWASRDLTSPLPPTIINGVVFVTSGGLFRTDDSKTTAAEPWRGSSRGIPH